MQDGVLIVTQRMRRILEIDPIELLAASLRGDRIDSFATKQRL